MLRINAWLKAKVDAANDGVGVGADKDEENEDGSKKEKPGQVAREDRGLTLPTIRCGCG